MTMGFRVDEHTVRVDEDDESLSDDLISGQAGCGAIKDRWGTSNGDCLGR